jgi:ribosome-associated heat shock protein Hsp15
MQWIAGRWGAKRAQWSFPVRNSIGSHYQSSSRRNVRRGYVSRVSRAVRAGHNRRVESTRIDRWLWAVRLTKTRPDAAAACRGGHVRVNNQPAKPATPVSPGDQVRVFVNHTTRTVEVVRVIQKRVGAAEAATCFIDHTPPPPQTALPVARRERGAGRPTKRERRVLDAWRAGQFGSSSSG